MTGVRVIAAPYHLGCEGVVLGAGVTRILEELPEIDAVRVHADGANEIAACFSLVRAVAGEVARAAAGGGFPLVLAGNCHTAALGEVTGLRQLVTSGLGVLWTIEEIRERYDVRAASVTAYDPACDPEGRIAQVAASLVRRLVAAEVAA